MTYTVFGIFDKHSDAEKVIHDLRDRGYEEEDISIVMKDDGKGKITPGKGAARGATTGAVVGGIAGLVAGVVIPGLGAFFIGGPIAAALGLTGLIATTATGAATGVVGGGILGALAGYGVSRQDAKEYEKRIEQGEILVAVPAREHEIKDVERMLADANADSIRSVELPEQRALEERYAEPESASQSQAYMGAKGGKTRMEEQEKTGRGWHGDPKGHAKAGKGEEVKRK